MKISVVVVLELKSIFCLLYRICKTAEHLNAAKNHTAGMKFLDEGHDPHTLDAFDIT